ncbi:hypothetical protein Tco_0233601 [Tanacetum coccineum]
MNRISSRRLSIITCVLWQCSQNISCVSKGKGLFDPNGERGRKVEVGFDNFGGGGEEVRNCGGNGGRGSSIFGGSGVSIAICSMESKDGLGGGGLVVVGGRSSSEECLDGWVRAGGGEVKGGGVDFGVTKSLLGEIPGRVRERVVVKNLELIEGPFDSRWVVIGYDKEGISDVGWRSNKEGHSS